MATAELAQPQSERAARRGWSSSRLSDGQFWTLIEDLSEPGGTFRSDNLLSNELQMQHVIRNVSPNAAMSSDQRFSSGRSLRGTPTPP